jgi:hypothetical protein
MNGAVMNNPEANAQFLASLPVGRWGKVEEIGALACYVPKRQALLRVPISSLTAGGPRGSLGIVFDGIQTHGRSYT